MRALLTFVLCVFYLLPQSISAQTIEPGEFGSVLRDKLRGRYAGTTVLSYDAARREMFSNIDNAGGLVRLVYSGSQFRTTGVPNADVVNTEHTWPQSKFRRASNSRQMKSDLHHLYPTWNAVNGARGSFPFGEIPDIQTDDWWNDRRSQSGIPASAVIDQYSESTDGLFEPREDHKGNVARSMFYFFTMYEQRGIDTRWFMPQVPTLMAWHAADPVDPAESRRTAAIKELQGNENPFVLDETLALRIFAAGPSDQSPVALTNRTHAEALSPVASGIANSSGRVALDAIDASGVGRLQLHFIDVDQGDSSLIVCPNGFSVLVDCGSLSNDPIVSRRTREYIAEHLEANHIDVVVITHPDSDHYRYLPDVLSGFQVAKLLHVGSADEHDSNDTDQWIEGLATVVDIVEADELDPENMPSDLFGSGDVKFHIIAAEVSASTSPNNARSIVMRVDLGEFEAVLTGDATFDTEEQIVLGYGPQFLDVELLKIGHHGSSTTSTSQGWIDILRPKAAVVSAGFQSRFQHPRKTVIDRVAESTVAGAPPHFMRWGIRQGNDTVLRTVSNYEEAIFSTSSNGHIVVTTDGDQFDISYGRPGRQSGTMILAAEPAQALDQVRMSNAVASISEACESMLLMDESLTPMERRARAMELELIPEEHSPLSARSMGSSGGEGDTGGRRIAESQSSLFPIGSSVSITTSAGTISGVLESIAENGWVTVREQGSVSSTLIRGDSIIIRPVR